MRLWFASPFLLVCLLTGVARAATIDDLRPRRTYYVDKVEFEGNHAFSPRELSSQLQTAPRPFYLVWKKRPVFDPDVFRHDLRHLRRYYRAQGYYSAQISYELQLRNNLVTALIRIHEGRPVKVGALVIVLDGRPLAPGKAPYDMLGLKVGDAFREGAYQAGEAALLTYLRNQGWAYAKVQRRGRVNLTEGAARVVYEGERGVRTVFGSTTVKGIKTVEPYLVLRALAYKPGDGFSQAKLDESRKQILALGLFSVVTLSPETDEGEMRRVPIVVTVQEKPKHSITIGGGYNTERQFIANLQWTDMNWLGGGRQFSILAGYSNITSTITANITQPYLFASPRMTGIVNFGENIEQVPPFTLFSTYIEPKIQYQLTKPLTLYAGYRLEYDKLISVDSTIPQVLGPIRESGMLSGLEAGLALNTTDNPYYPTNGTVWTVDALQGGGPFGGKFAFYRIVTEVKHYELMWLDTVLATRLKIGIADSLGAKENYPLFYRFYAGGEGSERGYGYWMLGPLARDHKAPLGGLSWIEGSFELRHQVWENLYGAAFLDFGQLSLRPYDLPVSDLQLSVGPALSYETPVGPLRMDLGIPLHKPQGQQGWQIYFSIGQYF